MNSDSLPLPLRRPTWAEIDLDAFAENLKRIRRKVAPAEVMAVVKADAYGHGAVPVARTVLKHGATYLGVALVEEGIELREAGIDAPILVFGGFFPEQADLFVRYNLEPTVYTEEGLKALSQAATSSQQPVKAHVKVDTGMGRVGVSAAEEFIQTLLEAEGVEFQGLYTHFASSDERDKSYAEHQLAGFNRLVGELSAESVRPAVIHAANSGAVLDMPDSYFDLVRPGIMLYGHYPSQETTESVTIREVMQVKTRVAHLKWVRAGARLSYGGTYAPEHDTHIAILPVGYADGYNRLLSNRGGVLIGGRRYPVVGRVCMDLTLVDVGPDTGVRVGDEVVLMGAQGDERITGWDISNLLNTIPYEVCCQISKRVPRLHVEHGSVLN